jgi:hypothetical protein
MSIEVDDVDQAHAVATERNLRIVYSLSDEPWGVRRFLVADPNGVVINIMSHRSAQRGLPKRDSAPRASGLSANLGELQVREHATALVRRLDIAHGKVVEERPGRAAISIATRYFPILSRGRQK